MNMNRRCGNAWSRLGTRALPLFIALLVSIVAPALAEATAITLAWDPNSDSVTAGYYVYYGIQSGNYSGYVDVGGATTAIINTQDSTTTYYFAIQAYSTSGERSAYSTEVVWTPAAPPAQPPTLNNPGSMSTTVGSAAVSLQLVATDPGGLALTYSASGLPPGLSIASNSGVISGTPTTAGGYNVTATVKNTANLTASQSFTWSILNQPAQSPSLLNPGNQTNVVGQSVSLQLSATDPGGLALQYSASGLPPGLSIASSTGLITGTPTTAGTYNITARATNTDGRSASQSFTWSILNQPVSTQPGNGKGGNGNGGGNDGGSNKGGNGNGNGGGGNGNGGGGSAGTSPIYSGVDPVAPVDSGTVVEDVTAPTVSILSPTSGSTYTTTNPKIVLTGIAVDDVGVVSVTWSNSRGGDGVALLGPSSWTTPAIDLKMGTNVLTITATDAAGNVQTITLTVTRNVDLQNQLN
jgi:Putative Ig domain